MNIDKISSISFTYKFDVLISELGKPWDTCHWRAATLCLPHIFAPDASHAIVSGHVALSPFHLHGHLYDSGQTSQPSNWLSTSKTLLMASLNWLLFLVVNKLEIDFLLGEGKPCSSRAWKQVGCNLKLDWEMVRARIQHPIMDLKSLKIILGYWRVKFGLCLINSCLSDVNSYLSALHTPQTEMESWQKPSWN